MKHFDWGKATLLTIIIISNHVSGQKTPPPIDKSMNDPIVYSEGRKVDPSLEDGGLPHAVGVHSFQVVRANRNHPPEIGADIGWTYNHQPYLAYWNHEFFLQYLSGEYQEHTPPTRVMLTTSKNGKDWSAPKTLFPIYDLPEIKTDEGSLPAGTKSVMHQRMGFYVAPNGTLLASGFYSYTLSPRDSPNTGHGLGRVVREIKKDGSYGPVYFIRYNRHAGFNESNTNFPFYKESNDKEFLEACKDLLKDKLITLQWWEEDRAKDGFYMVEPKHGAGKAFDFYHRPDGVVVGIWKSQWTALSKDDGLTWTPFTKSRTLKTTAAKVWAQKLDNGTYALVHNQTAGDGIRYPMVVMTSKDGHDYTKMYNVRADISDTRYQGIYKNIGLQYYRGIIEGNGNPPGDDFWVTYSENKEDIWVTSIKVPITDQVTENVDQDFETVSNIQDLKLWNILEPKWAPISLLEDTDKNNKFIELRDEDPYNYAKIERVFPKSKKVEISFDINTQANWQGHALEIEIQNQKSERPIKLRIDNENLMFYQFQTKAYPIPYRPNQWNTIKLMIDVDQKSYTAYYNGKSDGEDIPLAVDVTNVERIVFRTGPFKGLTNASLDKYGRPYGTSGLAMQDLPAAGEKVSPNVYWLDNVKIKKIR